MKKLDEIHNEITALKEYMFCQENGNDYYFSSPAYHKQLLELKALETEELVLQGKLSPCPIDFSQETIIKRNILNQLAEEKGIWYANYHKYLDVADLKDIHRQ